MGLKLVGGRLLPGPDGNPAAFYMYDGQSGERFTIYCSRTNAPDTALRYKDSDRTAALYWVDGKRGYVVSGPADHDATQPFVQQLAREIDIRAFLEHNGHLRQTVTRQRTRIVQAGQSRHRILVTHAARQPERIGERIDVTAVSKGKGFAGGMKRHNFKGLSDSHGTHRKHRSPGSIGAASTPARVFKGTRMAGQLGNRRVSTLNLVVIKADAERNLLLIRGAGPGPRGGLVMVRSAIRLRRRGGGSERKAG